MSAQILILTEAGDGIGYGHLKRCQAIADSLLEQSQSVELLTQYTGDADLSLELKDWRNDTKSITDRYSLILVDSYLATYDRLNQLKECCDYLAVIDDYERIKYPADIIINANIYGSELDYSDYKHSITGAEYLILRKEFVSQTQKYIVKANVKNILVSLGGRDVRGLAPTFYHGLSEDWNVIILAGSNKYKDELINTHDLPNENVIGFLDTPEFIEEILSCDLCISACGQSLNELTYLGVPTIGLSVGEDQVNNLKSYTNKNIIPEEIYWNSPNLIEVVKKCIVNYAAKEVREQVSERAQSMFSGEGSNNIAKRLLEIIAN